MIIHFISRIGEGGDSAAMLRLAAEQAATRKVVIASLEPPTNDALTKVHQVGAHFVQADEFERAITHAPTATMAVYHRNGGRMRVEEELLKRIARTNTPVYEFNTFGVPDPGTDRLFAGHFHPSVASRARYMARRGHNKPPNPHWVTGLAIDAHAEISTEERSMARARLDIPEDAFVLFRSSRPDLRKWSPIAVRLVEALTRRGLPSYLVDFGTPPERAPWSRRRLGTRLRLMPYTTDIKLYRLAIASADAVVNASRIGETFGVAFAEAMVLGLPGITHLTPTADQATREYCIHGVTGFVTGSERGTIAAAELLYANPTKARDMGQQARRLIATAYSAKAVSERMLYAVGAITNANAADAEIPQVFQEHAFVHPDGPLAATRIWAEDGLDAFRYLAHKRPKDVLRIARRRMLSGRPMRRR